MKKGFLSSDFIVILVTIGAIILIGILVGEKPELQLAQPVSQKEIDSIARATIIRDSISAISIAKQTEIAMKAQAAEDKKFYATKAGKIHKKHPEWSRDECKKLANREIWIGMHLDMLKYMHGLPDAANESNYGNGSQWQWCWYDLSPSCYYDRDNDGLIDAYN